MILHFKRVLEQQLRRITENIGNNKFFSKSDKMEFFIHLMHLSFLKKSLKIVHELKQTYFKIL